MAARICLRKYLARSKKLRLEYTHRRRSVQNNGRFRRVTAHARRGHQVTSMHYHYHYHGSHASTGVRAAVPAQRGVCAAVPAQHSVRESVPAQRAVCASVPARSSCVSIPAGSAAGRLARSGRPVRHDLYTSARLHRCRALEARPRAHGWPADVELASGSFGGPGAASSPAQSPPPPIRDTDLHDSASVFQLVC